MLMISFPFTVRPVIVATLEPMGVLVHRLGLSFSSLSVITPSSVLVQGLPLSPNAAPSTFASLA